MECLKFWPLIPHLFFIRFSWNFDVCRSHPDKYDCTVWHAVNRIALALCGHKHSINKHFTPTAAKGKHPRCFKIINVYKRSQGNRGKASCWKWVLKFTLNPMELWAGKRKYPNNSINSQPTGALFIGFIGLREVQISAKLYGAACSTSKDIRTWNASVCVVCWTKRLKVKKGDLHRSRSNWYQRLSKFHST